MYVQSVSVKQLLQGKTSDCSYCLQACYGGMLFLAMQMAGLYGWQFTDIHGLQTMKTDDFGDPPIFPLVSLEGCQLSFFPRVFMYL